MKDTSSLWKIIDEKSDVVLDAEKKRKTSSLWVSVDEKSDNISNDDKIPSLFATLKHRADAANEKPKALNDVLVKRVAEGAVIKKSSGVETKVNPLNVEYYVLRNKETNKYYQLTDRGKFLWDLMDGQHSVRDLALEYYNKYGALVYEEIIELIDNLEKNTFLNEEYLDLYKNYQSWSKSKKFFYKIKNVAKKYLFFELPARNIDKTITSIYESIGKYFFKKISLIIFFLISIIGTVSFFYLNIDQSRSSFSILDYPFAIKLLIIIGLNFICLSVHELGHALATKYYGRFIPRAGFLLYFGLPCLYVDTSDMWLEKSSRRIVVSSSGMIANAIFASIISIILLFLPAGIVSDLLLKLAWLSFMATVYNLNPLAEWDGYFILMDLLKIPCLRAKSFAFIKNSLLQKIVKLQNFSKIEVLFTTFGILSLVGSIMAVFTSVSFWQKVIS